MSQATCTWDNTTASRKRTRTKRYNEESWQAGRHTRNTGISSKATLPSAWRDKCTTPVCCQLWHYGADTWTLTKQAQNKLAAAQTKMERSMLNITYKDRRTNIWVRERKKFIDIIYTEKNEMVLGRAYQPPQRRPMDLARHHLETIWQEKMSRETSQAVERRPGQILERHDMAEDSTRQGHLETTCWGLRPTTGHNGCLMMMMMNVRLIASRWHTLCCGFASATDATMASTRTMPFFIFLNWINVPLPGVTAAFYSVKGARAHWLSRPNTQIRCER